MTLFLLYLLSWVLPHRLPSTVKEIVEEVLYGMFHMVKSVSNKKRGRPTMNSRYLLDIHVLCRALQRKVQLLKVAVCTMGGSHPHHLSSFIQILAVTSLDLRYTRFLQTFTHSQRLPLPHPAHQINTFQFRLTR